MSGRTLILAACALLSSGVLGCQRIVPPSTSKLNNAPLIIDPAMQKRDWDRTYCYYGNGDTVAGGTGYMFQTHETISDPWKRLVDPAVATGNIIALPVGLFVNTPFTAQTYQGEIVPPTYTFQPPLP